MTEPKNTSETFDQAEPSAVVAIPSNNAGVTIRSSWNFSVDNIRSDCARYDNEAKDALISAFLWCNDPRHPLSKPDFARRIGASDNLLYKLYTGKYRGPNGEQLEPSPELIKSIRQFLALEKERFEAGETTFVATPTAKKIGTACELARESQSIVFLWGPSHIGKTWALEHHAAMNNHGRTIYSRLEAASGLGGMVRRIAHDIGISDNSNTASLITRIKRGLTPETLLILDEVHLLAYTYRKGSFHNCMEVIREIHDSTKSGVVLCFTILDDVKAASQKELQQLWRRGVHKVPLPVMPTKGDIATILADVNLPFPARDISLTVQMDGVNDNGKRIKVQVTEKPYEILRQLARHEGLKAITERIRYGRKLASRAGTDLGWAHVIEAHLLIQKQATQEGEWH
jgi:DNA transposition AAA+ family ATPase